MGSRSTIEFRESLMEAKDNVTAYAHEMESEYRSDDVPIWDYDPTLLIGGTAQEIDHTEFLAEYMNGMMQAGDVRSRNETEAWDGSIVHDPATMVQYHPEDIRINPDKSFDMDQVWRDSVASGRMTGIRVIGDNFVYPMTDCGWLNEETDTSSIAGNDEVTRVESITRHWDALGCAIDEDAIMRENLRYRPRETGLEDEDQERHDDDNEDDNDNEVDNDDEGDNDDDDDVNDDDEEDDDDDDPNNDAGEGSGDNRNDDGGNHDGDERDRGNNDANARDGDNDNKGSRKRERSPNTGPRRQSRRLAEKNARASREEKDEDAIIAHMSTLSIDQIKLEKRLMLHELRTIAACCEKSKQSLSPKEVIEWNETRSDGDSISSDDPTVEEKAGRDS